MRGRHRIGRHVYRTGCAVVLLLGACGDDGKTDAAPVVDIDNGSCGDNLRFTGELVDWDATDAHFCGVFEANVMDGADGGQDTTAPNGRYDLCIARTMGVRRLSITPSADPSGCTSPSSTYTTKAILVADPTVILAGASSSGRLFTEARKTAFFAEMGIAYDATKAQVFVHAGTAKQITISATHAPAYAFTTTWAAGDTGTNVIFPNVDVGTGTITVNGTAIPLEANTLTLLSTR